MLHHKAKQKHKPIPHHTLGGQSLIWKSASHQVGKQPNACSAFYGACEGSEEQIYSLLRLPTPDVSACGVNLFAHLPPRLSFPHSSWHMCEQILLFSILTLDVSDSCALKAQSAISCVNSDTRFLITIKQLYLGRTFRCYTFHKC